MMVDSSGVKNQSVDSNQEQSAITSEAVREDGMSTARSDEAIATTTPISSGELDGHDIQEIDSMGRARPKSRSLR
jgi:hypothetical protein